MLQRILTAVIGIPALIALLWVRGWAVSLAVTVCCLIGMYEEYHAFRCKGHAPSVWPGIAISLLMWPAYAWKGTAALLPLAATAMVLCIFENVTRKKPDWIDAAASVYPIFTVFLPMSLFFPLVDHARQPIGMVLLVYAFAIAFGGDICAYFVGTFLGKRKLCPAVSPKKTVEGAIGGLIGAAALCMIAALICRIFGWQTPSLHATLLLALVGSIAAQVGDLSASLVKRHCGIKDFGSILPGHGGIMDRLDSVLFALIVVSSYMILFW